MEDIIFTSLQIREIFHLEFLRWFGRSVKLEHYAVKGGVNIRFFFQSMRYSEDMDLDIAGIGINALKDAVMRILQARSFAESLQPFGIKSVIPPDIVKAKQTQTTQRFKVHLITFSGEDLFTKVEFSRRGFTGKTVVGSVPAALMRQYKLPPLLVSHYEAGAAIAQKINALACRKAVQARDIFDLYILRPQAEGTVSGLFKSSGKTTLKDAVARIYEVDFEMFRDTVTAYLSPQDQELYGTASVWEEIRLNVVHFLEEAQKNE